MFDLLKNILGTLFPSRCPVCGKENEILCDKCALKSDYPNEIIAHDIFAATSYGDESIRQTIWKLKYKKASKAAEPLAKIAISRILEKIKTKDFQNPIIIPIPISAKKERQRGYNQAEILARKIFEKENLEIITDVLKKIKDTPSQVSVKDKTKRMMNVKDSFGVKNTEKIPGRNIILVDDVCTTGATIKEAKRILKEAGAKKVIGIVVAKG